MYTQSQQHVLEQVLLMGETFFSRDFAGLKICPRLFPLVVGPTGSGKTFLFKRAASELNAVYFRLTFGDWIPRGARDAAGAQTTFAILDALQSAERLVLHIDELDKCREDFDHSWSRSVANDLWNVLDGILPVQDWFNASGKKNPSELLEITYQRSRDSLWIVGSGTWQSVFSDQHRPTLGFASKEQRGPDDEDLTARIQASKAIPEELLARFASDLLFLHYPQSAKEKQDLLDAAGLTALAQEIGQSVRIEDIDMNGFGMRRIESLATQMLMARHRQKKAEAAKSPPPSTARDSTHAATFASKIVAPPQLVAVEPDKFETDACLVCGTREAPRITRLRRLRGKGRAGWAEIYVPDPRFHGFDAWCDQYGLPLPPLPVFSAVNSAIPEDTDLKPALIGSVEEFYSVLLHTRRRRSERNAVQFAYNEKVLNSFPAEGQRKIGRFEKYCTRRALKMPAFSDSESTVTTTEILRQIRVHVWEGALLALDWLQTHRPNSVASTDGNTGAIYHRVSHLWVWAVAQVDGLPDWDSVTEHLFTPESLSQFFDCKIEKRWEELPLADRLRIEDFFYTEQEAKI
jgi:hypothetical protein